MEYIEYIRVLVWPVTVILLIALFRKQASALVDRLSKAKFPGGEVEFRERLADLKETLEIKAPSPEKAPAELEDLEILDLARENPSAGLAVLRMQLERAIRGIYETRVDEHERRKVHSLSAMARELGRRQLVATETVALLLDILPLANQAVHGLPVRPIDAEELTMVGLRVLGQLAGEASDTS